MKGWENMSDDRFVRSIDGNIKIDNENGRELHNILEVGDLVTIEFYSLKRKKRVTRLFQIDYIDENGGYISFTSSYGTLSQENGKWRGFDSDLNPVIKSVMAIEKLESIEFVLPNSKSKSISGPISR